jgi:hypothetical protein
VGWSHRHADRVPERVLAATRLRPRAAADPAPCELPPEGVWLAVSAHRLYAFAAAEDDVGDLLEVWDRDATTVERAGGLTATRVALRFGANGRAVELETPRWRGGQHAFFRYLLDPSRTS